MDGNTLTKVFSNGGSCRGTLEQFINLANTKPATEVVTWLGMKKACMRGRPLMPWLSFMIPSEKIAKVAWLYQLYLTSETMNLSRGRYFQSARFQDYFQSVRNLLVKGQTAQVTEASKAYTARVQASAKQNKDYKKMMDEAYGNVNALCLYHKSLQCRKALKQALDWMYPREIRNSKFRWTGTFSLVDHYGYVFNDSKTMQYASNLALYLLDFVGSGRSQRMKIPEFYELGVKFFQGDMDRFWTFMGFMATRGSSFTLMYPIAHQDTKPLFASLMVISATMSLLDTLWLPTGTSFSYAKGNKNTCHQGKPYHYWMSGAYSYLLARQGYSKRTSILVARLLGAMYEVSSRTYGRQPEAVFFAETFAPVVMRSRREIIHHQLGSEIGIRGSHPQNFDSAMKRVIDNVQPIPQMPVDELRKKLQDPLTKWRYWTGLMSYYEIPRGLRFNPNNPY